MAPHYLRCSLLQPISGYAPLQQLNKENISTTWGKSGANPALTRNRNTFYSRLERGFQVESDYPLEGKSQNTRRGLRGGLDKSMDMIPPLL